MPKYCPRCEEEYVDHMTDCVDCQTALVDELPSPEEQDAVSDQAETWVPVYKGMLTDCQIFKTHLESADIACWIENENTAVADADAESPIVDVPVVHVNQMQQDLAQSLLSDLDLPG